MTSGVNGCRCRDISNPDTRLLHAAAKINIFEPHRTEGFVKAAQLLPHVATKHQKGAGWLLDIRRVFQFQVKAAVPAIDRVPGCEAVDAEDFQGEGGASRKPPDGEPALRVSVVIDQQAASGAAFFGGAR